MQLYVINMLCLLYVYVYMQVHGNSVNVFYGINSVKYIMYSILQMGFSSDSNVKESTCNAGDSCLTPKSGRSPGEGMATHSGTLAGEFHGQRSLAGYSYKIHIAPAFKELTFSGRL